MREIAGSENPHADKQAAEVNRERLQSEQEGTLRGGGQGPFAHQQPEACHGDEARKERPEKNLAIGMIGHTEKPERGERADDGAERVHQALERSEEHTSELQSHHDLVCRLLLEKKKRQK